MLYQDLWAKSEKEERGQKIPWHPLWCHLLDVAAVCKALLPSFWPDAPLPPAWLCYICALHDIGKADPFFQMKDANLSAPQKEGGYLEIDQHRSQGFRHESRSEEWLLKHLTQDCGWDGQNAQTVSKSVRAHHARFSFPERNQKIVLSEALPALWEPLRAELASLIRSVLEPPPLTSPVLLNHSADGIRLAGLLVLSDWIASSAETYDYPGLGLDAGPEHAAAYFAAACAEAEARVTKLGLLALEPPFPQGTSLEFGKVWPKITTLRPSQLALQRVVSEGVGPGLAIFEAPMGEGKTEMAIYITEEWRQQTGQPGTYIALPTQATSNQLHKRYERYLHDRDTQTLPPRLIHGMAWLREDDTPELPPDTEADAEALEWFASAKRALIAPEGVGTVDQALLAALFVRHGFLRLFGLAQKILIVDEVHAYDEHMTTILCRLLVWCRALQIPVVLLSATLSRRQKARLLDAYAGQPLPHENGYPLLTFAPWKGPAMAHHVAETKSLERRVTVCKHYGFLGNAEKIAAKAAEVAEGGGCVCVLVNTVNKAQEVFRHLQSWKDADKSDVKLSLFHARFRAEAREKIENKVLDKFGPHPKDKNLVNPDRPSKAILVATQVVENSLDVCFDVFLSELAPIDLLLQRSGRMHRHSVNPRHGHTTPVLHLFLPEEGTTKFGPTEYNGRSGVYERDALLRTLAALYGCTEFNLPNDFRTLIEQVYGEAPLPVNQPIPAEELTAATASRMAREKEAEAKARQHLIAEPDDEEFCYETAAPAVDEAEEGTGTADYLHAQTRLDDDSVACLLLSEAAVADEMKIALRIAAEKAAEGDTRWTPSRDRLRRFFRQKVTLPVYYPLPPKMEKAPRWLRHHRVIFAPQGTWQNEKGEVLRDDAELGVTKQNPVP